MSNTAESVLGVARGEIGYSRWNDPDYGTKYGRWYAAKVGNSYYGMNGVPYCAMFVSWVFEQAGAKCAGLPGAYCPTMLGSARAQGKAVAVRDAKPGDVVYFDWGGDGVSDHVGIVEANNGSYLTTIEGNTSAGTSGSQSNGGVVARRTRAYSTVIGIVRPDYGEKPGWFYDSGAWHYRYEDGSLAKAKWLKDGGWYYFDGNGNMVTGWNRAGTKDWYHFKEYSGGPKGKMDSAMCIQHGSGWCVIKANGKMVEGRSIEVDADGYIKF